MYTSGDFIYHNAETQLQVKFNLPHLTPLIISDVVQHKDTFYNLIQHLNQLNKVLLNLQTEGLKWIETLVSGARTKFRHPCCGASNTFLWEIMSSL